MTNIRLISTLHDPEDRMSSFLPLCMPHLTNFYQSLVVVATPATSRKTTDLLVRSKVDVDLEGSKHIGVSRRRALELGLQHNEADHFHYCDFDRLIHWVLNYPDELREVVTHRIQQADFFVIGRTIYAFDTHPQPQKETEALTNYIFSFVFGKTMDVTAGSCGMSRPAAEKILQLSTELSNATDTEWPMIIHSLAQLKLDIGYVEVQGLEYETPTFFGKEAFRRADTAENWYQRVRLCRQSIEAAIRLSESIRKDTNGGSG